LITGKIKKKYTITSTVPSITDALQSNTILVLAAHCSDKGNIKLGSKKLSASTYASEVMAKISNHAKITKIVYFACSANAGIAGIGGVNQLAPDALLTLTKSKLKIGENEELTPNQALALTDTSEGWIWTLGP
jgi:3-phosphoglycerate kinase